MALVNYATREINAKIVYYGPGLSGKTTNIHHVFERIKPKNKGKLISLATQGDRTLFFDFLPVELGNIRGFKTRFHLYTVPGQVFYNSTRKLVLKGADGVVFVADSQKMMMDENLQSMENLKSNLTDMGLGMDKFPVVIQYNKRDLPNAAPVEEMDEYLNPYGLPCFEASALDGDGVLKTLTAIVKFIMHDLKQDPEGHDVNYEVFQESEQDAGPLRAEDTETLPAFDAARLAVPPELEAEASSTGDTKAAPPRRATKEGRGRQAAPTSPKVIPADMEETAPASVPEKARPADTTGTPRMPAGLTTDEDQLDLSGQIDLPSGMADVEPAASVGAGSERSDGDSGLSGHIDLPSGVMDSGPTLRGTDWHKVGSMADETEAEPPPAAPEIFGALGVAEASSVIDDEEIYDAVEVPEGLADAIADDAVLPSAGAPAAGSGYPSAAPDEPLVISEKEHALFSDLARGVPASVGGQEQGGDVGQGRAAREGEEAGGPDVFAEFAGRAWLQPGLAEEDGADGHVLYAEETSEPMAWDAAIHEAEGYVEETSGPDDKAGPGYAGRPVTRPEGPDNGQGVDNDMFDVYFGPKALRPSPPGVGAAEDMSLGVHGGTAPGGHDAETVRRPAADTPRPSDHPGHPAIGSRQVFTIPVRITTTDGLREVTLKVSVDVEIEGEGLDSIKNVEVLQPFPKVEEDTPTPDTTSRPAPQQTPMLAAKPLPKLSPKTGDDTKLKPPDSERPARMPAPMPMPKAADKKFSVLQKILGMK